MSDGHLLRLKTALWLAEQRAHSVVDESGEVPVIVPQEVVRSAIAEIEASRSSRFGDATVGAWSKAGEASGLSAGGTSTMLSPAGGPTDGGVPGSEPGSSGAPTGESVAASPECPCSCHDLVLRGIQTFHAAPCCPAAARMI